MTDAKTLETRPAGMAPQDRTGMRADSHNGADLAARALSGEPRKPAIKPRRNRKKQVLSLDDRIQRERENAQMQADRLARGEARDAALMKVREMDAALQMNGWLKRS